MPTDGVTGERDLYGPQALARDVHTLSFNNGQVPGHIHWEVGGGTLTGVALATAGRFTYFASVHGYANDAADVAMVLAILRSARGDHVTGVGPAVAGCRAVVAK